MGTQSPQFTSEPLVYFQHIRDASNNPDEIDELRRLSVTKF